MKADDESILRVWAVSLAEREGESDETLRRLALGEEVGAWRALAAARMANPGDDPLAMVIQPLGDENS